MFYEEIVEEQDEAKGGEQETEDHEDPGETPQNGTEISFDVPRAQKGEHEGQQDTQQ